MKTDSDLEESSEEEEDGLPPQFFDEEKVRELIRFEMSKRPKFEVELDEHKKLIARMVKSQLTSENFSKINQLPDVISQMTRMKDNNDLALQQVVEMGKNIKEYAQ